jgi:hypothetical protein
MPAIPMPGTITPMTEQEAAIKFAAAFNAPDEESALVPPSEPTPPEEAPAVTDESATTEQTAEDAESVSEDEETPEEPSSPPPPPTFKVKVDGEEREVPLEELVKGYSRTEDYTRKTQKLAEERKASESELLAVRAEREQYAATLGKLEEFLTSSLPKEPDWVQLQRESPEQFPAEFATWQVRERQLKEVQAERSAADAKVLEDRKAELTKVVEAERHLTLEKIPEWSDAAKAKAEWNELVKYAEQSGYQASDLNAVVDHRVIVMLRKAMLHDRATQATTPPPVKKAAPVMQPGAAQPAKKPVTDLTRSKQRLAKTGDVRDAADVFLRTYFNDTK